MRRGRVRAEESKRAAPMAAILAEKSAFFFLGKGEREKRERVVEAKNISSSKSDGASSGRRALSLSLSLALSLLPHPPSKHDVRRQ